MIRGALAYRADGLTHLRKNGISPTAPTPTHPRKTSAGPEAAKQFYCDIKSFNDKVDHVLGQLGRDDADPMKRRRYHLAPKLPPKEFVRDSGDAQVLLLLTHVCSFVC